MKREWAPPVIVAVAVSLLLAFLFTWLHEPSTLYVLIPLVVTGTILTLIKYRSYQTFEKVVETVLIKGAGVLILLLLCLIVFFLVKESIPFISNYNMADFFTSDRWIPSNVNFGALGLIAGSLLVTLVAVVFAVPVSIALALFISQVAPRQVREILKSCIEVFASVPTVIFGFIGIMFLGPFMQGFFGLENGLNALTAGLLLGLMAVPIITSVSEEAMAAQSPDLKMAATALGANRLQVMLRITLPAALPGVLTAVLLGMGRAIGETMTVLMVAGNSRHFTLNVFESVRTITATIGAEQGTLVAGSIHYHALFMLGLILFLMTLAMNTLGTLVVERIRHKQVAP